MEGREGDGSFSHSLSLGRCSARDAPSNMFQALDGARGACTARFVHAGGRI